MASRGHFTLHQGASVSSLPCQPQVDWQSQKPKLSERGAHLLETGIWSDCQFVVGLPPNVKVFRCHRMFLAMASPVFEAMFFGGLAEKENHVIKILDVQPEAFRIMLEYVYTDEMNLNNFELVCDICYAAKKYMLPTLVEECTKYLWRDLYPRNACRAYEFARLFEEPILMEKSIQMICTQTREILSESTFEEIDISTLSSILAQESISADEALLFEAAARWSLRECERRGLEATPERRRACLGEAIHLVRYLTFTASEFAAGPAQSGLLTQEESFAILMNISAPGSWEIPDHMASLERMSVRRKDPRDSDDGSPPLSMLDACDVDMSVRVYCKRAMMQEPHCLNTSILDCSVTFTVDKDMCIHGIEVPSQVTDIPDSPQLDPALAPALAAAAAAAAVGLPTNASPTHGQSEYNELLYAHLLDADGNRLTYTHFTAKVVWNSMIDITFNRSVYVKANKVYRIGMVLNKVGWYPMGVCTRRVKCEDSFFTFCVGQPNDTLRDGLIRSIIFSK